MRLGRRSFLISAAGVLVSARPEAQAGARYRQYPFTLGVASGDPLADGVVLWTRLAPAPLDDSGGMPPESIDVRWEVADDDGFRRVLRSGRTSARPAQGHAVHVDVRGLNPDRWYWYRFLVRDGAAWIESPHGRTRTAPRPGATLAEYRLAYASCQRYEDGHYTALSHLCDEDVHLVFFLGDYIYETAPAPDRPRPHQPVEARTLDDYRRRYALYKSDQHLQRAHQLFPWMVTWDDHEVLNDYTGPDLAGTPEGRVRLRAAYQAFLEHIPIRASWRGDALRLHRHLQIGGLAQVCMLDTRQYRSPHACGGGLTTLCDEALAANRTVLGREQERWLSERIQQSSSRWQVLAQQIPFAPVDREPGPGVSRHMDKWDGYPAARDRIVAGLASRSAHDAVILTGDNHNNWVMEVRPGAAPESSPPAAIEFVGTSISSTGDGAEQVEPYASALADNPHARYLNSRRGYVRCLITPRHWQTDFRVVPYVSAPGAPISTAASFVMTHGVPGVERA